MHFTTSMTMVDRIIGSAPFVYEGDFAQGVALARELGFDAVELHIADPAKLELPPLEAALRENGIALSAIGTGRAYVNDGLSITDPDDNKRQAAIRRLEDFIALGARLHATVIIGCMRGNVTGSHQLPLAMKLLTQSMIHLDRVARDQGVTLVFEPINRYENNFLCNMTEIAQFIRQTGLTNTGILADTFHMNIEEADLIASIQAYAPELKYVHIADSNRLYPGGGHIDFAALLKALDEAGYHGVLSAECLPLPSKLEAAQGWLRSVKALMA